MLHPYTFINFDTLSLLLLVGIGLVWFVNHRENKVTTSRKERNRMNITPKLVTQ